MPSPTNSTAERPENELLDDHLELLRAPSEKLLMAALAQGHYRLAVQCERCGTWLVAAKSVQRHLGPVCARHSRIAGGNAA